MKLIIRNLDRTMSEAELKELFEQFGTVQSCNLIMDEERGTSKGFGFIEMPKTGDAKAAIINLNDKVVGESKVRVKKADVKTS